MTNIVRSKVLLNLFVCLGLVTFVLPAAYATSLPVLGVPFVPAGSTGYKIYALQGIPVGAATLGRAADVLLNNEFNASIGVTVLDPTNHAQDFGIGLEKDTWASAAGIFCT